MDAATTKNVATTRSTQASSGEDPWDVFVSSPMSSFPTKREYSDHRIQIRKVVDALRKEAGFSRVYWASERFKTIEEFEEKNVAFDKDSLIPTGRSI
jgi:hypothetical protein